jgi:putative ABC transport system permease protein
MFKSYLKLALRNLWKRKANTAINILSLSVGLAACALVFLFCKHEFSFDKDFEHGDDVYRIVSNFGGNSLAPTVPFPYAKYLKSEIPEIDEVSRLDPTVGVSIVQVQGNGPSIPYSAGSGYWVDPEFFEVLPFKFLSGNRKTAFEAPNTIVLSASLAKKLFGSVDPVGKLIKASANNYTVTGVFDNNVLNHIRADFFASNRNSHFNGASIDGTSSWVVNPNFYTYVRLKHGSSVQHVNDELKAYTIRHAGVDMKATGNHMVNSLQALHDIHLHSFMYQDYLAWKQGNIQYLYLLVAIALIILLLGCINYINLTTAQAIGRAREVGVRRVMGAGKNSIRYQFLIETVLISLFAMVIAIGLGFLFLPEFNTLTGQTLSFFDKVNQSLIWWVLLITLITGLLVGLYPAFYLSSFKAVQVLKGKISATKSVFNIRHVLIISQFVISTFLVIATTVIWNQLHFMINSKPGFNMDQQLVLNLNSGEAKNNSESLITQLKNNPDFKSVSGAADALVSDNMNFYPQGKTINDKHLISLNLGDADYLKTLGLQLISGGNFTPEVFANTNMQEDLETNDIGRQIILNEEAVKAMGFYVNTAPGHYISHIHNDVVYNYKVVGVVKNYHYYSLHAPIGPFAIMPVNPKRFSVIVANINGRQMAKAIKYAKQSWNGINPDTPFSYSFLNDIFQGDYVQDERAQQMSWIFTCVAIFISCLGLLGLVTYSVTQKTREIGIRKVVGASVSNIVMLFSKQYFKLILIANLIAWPLAWYAMDNWLQRYPYKTAITWWVFAVALAAGILIAFCTIAFKTIKAAMVNPVNSLGSE